VSSVTLWVCTGIGALVLCSLMVLLAWWAVVALVCHVGCRLLAIQNRHWRRPAQPRACGPPGKGSSVSGRLRRGL